MYCCWSSGTASSAKIAVTGHSGSQAPQSMHSSGSMKYIESSSVAWMQSTGQTSTHEASFTPMHGSVITYVMALVSCGSRHRVYTSDGQAVLGDTAGAGASLLRMPNDSATATKLTAAAVMIASGRYAVRSGGMSAFPAARERPYLIVATLTPLTDDGSRLDLDAF